MGPLGEWQQVLHPETCPSAVLPSTRCSVTRDVPSEKFANSPWCRIFGLLFLCFISHLSHGNGFSCLCSLSLSVVKHVLRFYQIRFCANVRKISLRKNQMFISNERREKSVNDLYQPFFIVQIGIAPFFAYYSQVDFFFLIGRSISWNIDLKHFKGTFIPFVCMHTRWLLWMFLQEIIAQSHAFQ